MTTNYSAQEITVLKDLEPVQIRPGMYTDTTRPNHLAQEVIDNSVDEALAGFATKVEVILHADQSLEVIDNGRGMPVDIQLSEALRELPDKKREILLLFYLWEFRYF